MENTIIQDDQDRAQAILDAISALIAACDADDQARAGRGGSLQSVSGIKGYMTSQGRQFAIQFDLAWSGDGSGSSVDNIEPPLH